MPEQGPTNAESTVKEDAVGHAPTSEIVRAELAEPLPPTRRRRRVWLPLMLFLLTCGSTFFAGATRWWPADYIDFSFLVDPGPYALIEARLAILDHWRDGVIYTGCVLAILLTHEMGHFVMTVIYRVRATLPFFIPFPVSPIGTMGAVILMDGSRADRRQSFDIGLAGPIAGLLVAIPIVWIGTSQLDFANTASAGHRFGLPWALQLLVQYLHPGANRLDMYISQSHLNPYFMAGWVGLIVTGLNMMPVSQLDGGHVTYALFGRKSHWIARLFMLGVFVYMGVMYYLFKTPPAFLLMAVLILLMGTDHPPTRDDTVPLGWFRILLGMASLLIPVLCFTPNLID